MQIFGWRLADGKRRMEISGTCVPFTNHEGDPVLYGSGIQVPRGSTRYVSTYEQYNMVKESINHVVTG